MVYDDDEGAPPFIDIRASEHPTDYGQPVELPARAHKLILKLGRRRGYGPERICSCLAEEGYDVSVSTIRQILASAGLLQS